MKRRQLEELGLERLSNEDMKTIIGGAVVHGNIAYEPQMTAMAVAADGDPEDPETDPNPNPDPSSI